MGGDILVAQRVGRFGETRLSRVYLVRHGQAGTREAYDSLSALGKRQARLLGEYFLSEGIEFAAVFSGTLARQAQTALEVKAACHDAGAPLDVQWLTNSYITLRYASPNVRAPESYAKP